MAFTRAFSLIHVALEYLSFFRFDLIYCATYNNISAMSWPPVLVVEEAGVHNPERPTDHGQATGKLYHLQPRVECNLFVIYKAGPNPRVLVIGLYVLLGNQLPNSLSLTRVLLSSVLMNIFKSI